MYNMLLLVFLVLKRKIGSFHRRFGTQCTFIWSFEIWIFDLVAASNTQILNKMQAITKYSNTKTGILTKNQGKRLNGIVNQHARTLTRD
ncbi:hypothetical protein BDV19DRAFT_335432 [Aspergillus venezuelensis]